jgi:hypothetical protein
LALFVGLLLLLLFIGRTRLLHDPDTFWHIMVGRQILQTGRLVQTDGFTVTFAGKPWTANQWLAECLMALIDRLAGFDGLVIVTAAALAGLYAWAGNRLIRRGLHWLPTLLVLAFVLAASSYNLHARPHITTIVFLGIIFALLCAVQEGRIKLVRPWWLVPMVVLWSNLHGGVLGGIATLALVAGGWMVERLLGWPSPVAGIRHFFMLVGLVIACTLCILVNPYGLQLPKAWMAIMEMDLPDLIIEHAPLDPTKPEGQMVLVLGVLYVAVLVSLRRLPRVTELLPLVWFFLACTRIRHAPLFAIVAVVALADLLPRTRWSDWLQRRGFFQTLRAEPEPSERRAADGWPVWGAATMFGLLFVVGMGARHWGPLPVVGDGWAKPNPAIWPVEVLPELKRYQQQQPEGTPIFNEQHYGGFLIYNTPGLRVFIDGRCELFGEDFLREYTAARKTPEILSEWIDKYDLRAALTETGSPFDRYFDTEAGWSLVRKSPSASFYVRQDSVRN